MRRAILVTGLMLAWFIAPDARRLAAEQRAAAQAPGKPLTIDVWPGQAPGEKGAVGAEKVLEGKPGERPVKRITNVTRPTLTVFKPARDKDTGAAVLIAPGGGYNILAWDLEGEEVAGWLNSLGVTGIVLKYRVPRRPGAGPGAPPQALMDAQRALSLVRSKAGEWGIDPKRIGMLGFSAGGHLTAWASTNFDRRSYEPGDAIDKVSCRPDFTVLVYPAYLLAKGGQAELSPEIRVTKTTPPTFLAHAGDDGITAENSVALYRALKKAGLPAELHVYATGGHGFGLRPSNKPCSTWPRRCAEWLQAQGFLKGNPAH
jgi:acetyl esterase/lipase